MKRYFYLALCVGLLCSCNSDKKGAIEFVKNQMKCPSSFKVVTVEESKGDKEVVHTLYHVAEIYGFQLSSGTFIGVDSVYIDSIKDYVRSFPPYKRYNITYDSQNLYGAMVRGQESVALYKGQYYREGDFRMTFGQESERNNMPYDSIAKCALLNFVRQIDWYESVDIWGAPRRDY